MKYNEIKMEEFDNLKIKMNGKNINNIIEIHKKLIGKKAKDKYFEINDCGLKALWYLLNIDWGRSIVFQYNSGAIDFIKSKYLSDYIKNELKTMLGKMNYYSKTNDYYNDNMKNLLNSNKSLNEMSEEEIKYIYNHLKKCMYNKNLTSNIDTTIVSCFKLLLYKLDGKGIASLLKDDNFITKTTLADHILLTTGLNNRSSYYSGRGVNNRDLSNKNLTEIFRKLIKIDFNYGVNFIKMIMEMKTLGATEFIDSFKELAENNFNFEDVKIKNSNISLDNVYDEDRNVVAIMSILSSNKEDMGYQIHLSNQMKRAFLNDIRVVLKEINPEMSEIIQKKYINRIR